MTDHMISEDQLSEQFRADRDEAGTVYLIGLADGALRLVRRRQRVRTGLASVAVLAVAAVGATSNGWIGGGTHTVTVGPAAPVSSTVVPAQQISFMPVASSKPGACPPGGGYSTNTSYEQAYCYQLDRAAALTATTPGAVATRSPQTGAWEVELTLHGKDVPALASLTGSTVGRQLALVVDGKVLDAPSVASKVTDGHLEITGDFTQKSATALADRLTGR